MKLFGLSIVGKTKQREAIQRDYDLCEEIAYLMVGILRLSQAAKANYEQYEHRLSLSSTEISILMDKIKEKNIRLHSPKLKIRT